MGGVPGVRFLPNAITVLALCAGLTSVAFAMSGQWRLAVGAIGAAALGLLADATSITFVYKVCAFLPLMGLLTVFLPDLKKHE